MKNKVLKMEQTLFGFKHSAKICFDTVFHGFKTFNSDKEKATLCIFYERGMTVICYIDDLLIFAKRLEKIDSFKVLLDRYLVVNGKKTSNSFHKMELDWSSAQVLGLRYTALIGKSFATHEIGTCNLVDTAMSAAGLQKYEKADLNENKSKKY